MSTQPIDYAALAAKFGAVSSEPAKVDYEALAKKFNGVSTQTLDPNQPGMQAKPSGFYADLKNMAVSLPESLARMSPGTKEAFQVKDAVDDYKSIRATGKTQAQLADDSRAQAGYGIGYRALAPQAQQLGVNVQGMEQSAREGDQMGVLGHAAAAGVPVVAGAIGGEMLKTPQAQSAIGKVSIADIQNPARDAFNRMKAGNQAVVMPEAGKLPIQAQEGAEHIFRAAAPTGMNQGFRANVYAAAPDLADIARKIDLSETKGGIINPDMRVRATVNAISEHLDEMYKTERAPQIQAHADAPIDIPLGDATRGLEFIKRSGGTLADQALADKAIKTGTLTLAEADKLAMTANQYLKSFESMTPSEKLEAISKTPKIGGLKALDVALGENMNKVLTDAGEPGLRSYERRFAALAEVRDQLATRMNATELKQEGLLGAAGRVTRPMVKLIQNGPSGIASASQAAVADVNAGKMLQHGMNKLRDSGIGLKKP